MTPTQQKTIDEINRLVKVPSTPRYDLLDLFLDIADVENWDELYAPLAPEMKQHLIDLAILNKRSFDEVLQGYIQRGEKTCGWIAFRDWAHTQRAFLEAPIRKRLTDEEIARYFAETSRQANELMKNRLAHMRADSDEERARLDREHEEMEERFDREAKELKATMGH